MCAPPTAEAVSSPTSVSAQTAASVATAAEGADGEPDQWQVVPLNLLKSSDTLDIFVDDLGNCNSKRSHRSNVTLSECFS